jgi:hypothetical protein
MARISPDKTEFPFTMTALRCLPILAVASFAFAVPLYAEDLTLVADGNPVAVIVVPLAPATQKNAEATFLSSATDLQALIRRISGASLEIVGLEQWQKRAQATPAIFLGCAPSGSASPEVTNEEGSRIQASSAGVIFAVNGKVHADFQERAMQYAVNRFAQKALGCRWLMPGELGEVIPHQATLVVPHHFAEEESPVFWSRKMRDRQESGHTERLARVRDRLPQDESNSQAPSPMGAEDWLQRMNMGQRFHFEFGHSFGGWWEKYGKAHPEFFALQPNGTRTQLPHRERLCESEPKLWDQVAANAIAAFDADPNLRMFSICENDGGANAFCMCPRCMALDPPGAPKLMDSKIYDPKTGQPFPEGYPALSDRVFTFFNEVARRVKEKYPDRFLGVYAYSVYRTVPVNLSKLEDNLIVSVVSDDDDQVAAWSKLAPKMFVRPNAFWDGKFFGIARNDAHRLGRLMQTAASDHVYGFDWDGLIGNWATQGLNYYVVAQLLWDPGQDIDALINDYIESAYGKAAAPAMRRYFDQLEKLTAARAGDPTYKVRKSSPAPLITYYSEANLADLEKCVLGAEAATATGSPERQRVELVQAGLEYTRRVCAMIAHIADPNAGATYNSEWKTQAAYFAGLARDRYFGTEQNLTKLTPALQILERRKR